MSLPKQEIWGAPSTWIYSKRQPGLETTAAKLGNFDKPKTANFGTGSSADYEGALVRAINVAHTMTLNEYLDESICPCGQAPDVSPFGKVALMNENKNFSTTPSSIYTTEKPVNWFFADVPSVIANLKPYVFYRDYGRLKYQQFAPKAFTTVNSAIAPMNLVPYVKYGLKTLVLSIEVGITANANNPITGAQIWVSLDDWKNNYSTTHYVNGLRLFVRCCTAINSTTLKLTYSDERNISTGQRGALAILNKFNILNDGKNVDTQFLALNRIAFSSAYIFDKTPEIFNEGGSTGANDRAFMPAYQYFENQTIEFYREDRTAGYYYYKIPYSENNYNKFMQIAALFGCFFTPTNKYVFDYDMLDNDLYLPIIDENGVAHGQYTKGAANATNTLYSKNSIRDIDYDPTKPPTPPAPTPSGDPILPKGLQFTLAGRGTGIWALTPGEIDQVWSDVFGSGIKPTMFGNNPMNAILSLKWTPFVWNPSGTDPYSPIVLGDTAVNELHEYPVINTVSTSERHAYGSIKFQFDKNFFNARYMQARLFLPFYGYYELPAAQLLSSELRVDFYYNVPDELGVYIICYDDVVYDYVECCCDMEVPLTGSNAAAISASKRSEALSIATQVGAAAATAIMGASAIKALGTGLSNIAAAGYEGAWGYGGGIKGFIGAAKDSIGIMAEEGFINPRGMAKGGAALGGMGLVGKGIANTVYNASVERAALKTNLPYHGSALQTTFLHMSMVPYVQIFRNAIMEGLENSGNAVDQTLSGNSEAQYKLKVGHACDVWTTISKMPENSLLQATGIADSTVVNMELAEVQELNGILQSGFYR